MCQFHSCGLKADDLTISYILIKTVTSMALSSDEKSGVWKTISSAKILYFSTLSFIELSMFWENFRFFPNFDQKTLLGVTVWDSIMQEYVKIIPYT